jgi:hypothetical protein
MGSGTMLARIASGTMTDCSRRVGESPGRAVLIR